MQNYNLYDNGNIENPKYKALLPNTFQFSTRILYGRNYYVFDSSVSFFDSALTKN